MSAIQAEVRVEPMLESPTRPFHWGDRSSFQDFGGVLIFSVL
jgi:hypothetical protein